MINQNKDFLTLEEFIVFVFNNKEIMRIFLNQHYIDCMNEGKYSVLN
jgi:hypothetical protein